MNKIKLKDLKYQVPGQENPKPGREVLMAIFITPIIMVLLIFCVVLSDIIDEHGWRYGVAIIITSIFIVMAIRHRKI
jgi:hypothetical protein